LEQAAELAADEHARVTILSVVPEVDARAPVLLVGRDATVRGGPAAPIR